MNKLLFRFGLSVAIGAVLLYLVARKLDFSTTWGALSSTDWSVLVPYFAVMVLQHLFRAWRWGHLLAPICPVPFQRILPIATVGFLAILALPLRMGELVRPYLVAAPPKLRMSQSFGTLAVERVFDGLVLSLGAFGAVALAQKRTQVPGWLSAAGLVALVLFVTALAALIMALWRKDKAVSLCRRLFSIVSKRLGDRLAQIAEGVVDGFKVLPNWNRLLPFLAATFCYWFLNAVAAWILAGGFQIDLTLGEAYALMSLVGIGIMIPAGPGFIGNFELFAEGALGLYLSPTVLQQRGAAFILTYHVTNALWYAFAGALALFSREVTLKRVWSASTADEDATRLAAQ